jgi:tight adherence protein B
MTRRSPQPADELDALASVVQRLAVLLTAGVPPTSAWGYLADAGQDAHPSRDDAATVSLVAAAAQEGGQVHGAIMSALDHAGGDTARSSGGWRGLAAAWSVATDAGAPLASTLDEFASALRDLAQTEREVQVALAGPVATAKMVMALPAIGVLFGAALGFDTVGTLFGTPIGFFCLLVGSALMCAARIWNRRLLASASRGDATPGLVLDLVAIAVSGGASTERAVRAVDRACEASGIPASDDRRVVDDVLGLSRRAGVPAAVLLRSEAEEARRRSRSNGARRAATLSVTLMLPLGLCILPAFMLLGVAPLMVAVISSTVANF